MQIENLESGNFSSQADWANEYDYTDYDYNDFSDEDDPFEEAFTKERQDEELHKKLPPEIYCDLVNTLNAKCLENSILELWKFDRNRINKLTNEKIINDVNRFIESPVYGFKFNFSTLLGGIVRNSSNHVVSATAAIHIWNVEIDPSKVRKAFPGVFMEIMHFSFRAFIQKELALSWIWLMPTPLPGNLGFSRLLKTFRRQMSTLNFKSTSGLEEATMMSVLKLCFLMVTN